MVDAGVFMGRALNLRTIAEGNEQPEHVALLRQLGGRYGLGYRVAHPCRVDKVKELITRTRDLPAPSSPELGQPRIRPTANFARPPGLKAARAQTRARCLDAGMALRRRK